MNTCGSKLTHLEELCGYWRKSTQRDDWPPENKTIWSALWLPRSWLELDYGPQTMDHLRPFICTTAALPCTMQGAVISRHMTFLHCTQALIKQSTWLTFSIAAKWSVDNEWWHLSQASVMWSVDIDTSFPLYTVSSSPVKNHQQTIMMTVVLSPIPRCHYNDKFNIPAQIAEWQMNWFHEMGSQCLNSGQSRGTHGSNWV